MQTSLYDDVQAALYRYKVQGFNRPTILIIDDTTYQDLRNRADKEGVPEFIPHYRHQKPKEGNTYMDLQIAVLENVKLRTVRVL